ncbi:hypothetical protein Lalb_Chr17g0339191 [Lupinus albus]|uniref:Uncharacterized protein n=1 Tax=Lupinus albus TaxID=3870 RepID=A0A6A4NYU8_LUPAL|nr:hypothetical protein Lalb_Chr17g0339191 [Lupinus albus]
MVLLGLWCPSQLGKIGTFVEDIFHTVAILTSFKSTNNICNIIICP